MATRGERHLALRREERLRDESGHKAGWTFLWTLFAFKIATVGIIWYAATSTHADESAFLVATTWYWFLIPAIAISGPLLYRWRLLRQRRRREALRGAEWMDRPHGDGNPMTVADIVREHEHRRA